MADIISKKRRSWNMSRIRSSNSKIELKVRSRLHKEGFRFRLYSKDLPGKPDIVLKKFKTVIFVHGCFWHRHKSCKRTLLPKSNREYWKNKFKNNKKRDSAIISKLYALGWDVEILWECEVLNDSKFNKRIFEIVKLLNHK